MGMQIGKPSIDTNGLVLYFDGTNPYQYAEIPGLGLKWIDPLKKNDGIFSYPSRAPAFDYNYNSLIFNGYSDYLNITGRPELYLNDTAYSICAWIRTPAIHTYFDRKIIDIPSCLNMRAWGYDFNEFHYDNIYGYWNRYFNIPKNTWILLTITVDKSGAYQSNFRPYINTQLVDATIGGAPWPVFSNYSSRNITIGGKDTDCPFAGHIGMVAIYNRQLSNSEIIKLYNNTKNNFKIPTSAPLITDGLVLYLDPSKPNSYSGNTWYDLSGRNNHATLVNLGINPPIYDTDGGGSFLFNGIDNYAEINHSTDVDLNDNLLLKQHTIFITYQPNSINYSSTLFQKGSQYGIGQGGTSMSVYPWYGPNSTMNNGVWYNLCYQYDGNYRTAYFDSSYYGGVIFGQRVSSIVDNSNVTIAKYMKAKVAQILMYNRALSAAEVLQNFDSTKNRIAYS